MKLGPNQTKWIEALRSGDYEQCTDRLFDGKGYCCLGVAAVVCGGSSAPTGIAAPNYAVEGLALRSSDGELTGRLHIGPVTSRYLADANDAGATFSEIADFIEANPEAVFREPK